MDVKGGVCMNVPTITIGGEKPEDNELEKLRMENRELAAKCENLERKLEEMRHINELTYLRGRCDGLEFSISHKKPGEVATA